METKSIFENSKFGDKFRTRDGRMAIFLQFDEIVNENGDILGKLAYIYTLQDGEYSVALNGISTSENDIILHNKNTDELNEDIVSEWQEEINEEKLDKLACSKYPDFALAFGEYESCEDLRDAYKEGYRKAKEG